MLEDRIQPTAVTYTVMARSWVINRKFDTLADVLKKKVRVRLHTHVLIPQSWTPDQKFFESVLRVRAVVT